MERRDRDNATGHASADGQLTIDEPEGLSDPDPDEGALSVDSSVEEPVVESSPGLLSGTWSTGGPERLETVLTWSLVAICCGFVFYSLHPDLIFANTTPTGGDMGAHVWGPAFLRDHLLGQFRLSGWTQDWYAGFPAYVFYMVVPSLMILWLAFSPPWWLAVALLAGLVALSVRLIPRIRTPWQRHLAVAASVFFVVLFLPIPYNIAFKLVVVSGLVTLPIAACALARSLAAPFPIAPLAALATLPFIYDKGFTILGGNGASTMAGEFAFSISLSLAIFYLAVLFRGAENGRWRVPGAILLALTVLCHIIPAIFVVVVTIVVLPFLRRAPLWAVPSDAEPADDGAESPVGIVDHERSPAADEVPAALQGAAAVESVDAAAAVGDSGVGGSGIADQPWWTRSRWGAAVAAALIFFIWVTLVVDRTWLRSTANHSADVSGLARLQHLFPALATFAALVFFTSFQPRLKNWITTRAGSVAAAAITVVAGAIFLILSSGWTLAIVLVALAGLYFVSVDWRVVTWVLAVAPVAALVIAFWMLPFLMGSTYMNDMGWEKYTKYWDYLLAVPELDSGGMPMRSVILVTAGIGVILSVLMKVRMGWFLGLVVLVFAWMFRFFPQYRLWNARLLPFYFLAIYLLAGLAAGLVIRLVVESLERRSSTAGASRFAGPIGATVVVVVVLVSLLGSFKQLPGGTVVADPAKPDTNVYSWAGLKFPLGIVPDWASWNFSGTERKPAYPEFKGIVDMMRNVGENNGCGRAFWEFDPELNRFGTTMSLMMLPYYSNGCIGSMEGLYFEASSTTPFHFLMQSALSASPSRAQREMPYPNLDIELGVSQMQLMGVRYYMASSDQAIEAADKDARLTKVADETFSNGDAGAQQRWVVYELKGVRLVEGLANEPVVLKNANDHIDGWVYDEKRLPPTEAQKDQGIPGSKTAGPAVRWFMDPTRWNVFLATSGPSRWPRAGADDASDHMQPNPPVAVSNLKMDQQSVSFDVDRTGVPVLVKVSYFPNWKVTGGTGPYRVSPNFMVVVPTSKHVSLSFGRSAGDIAGAGLSVAGVAGLFGLAVLDERRRRAAEADHSA